MANRPDLCEVKWLRGSHCVSQCHTTGDLGSILPHPRLSIVLLLLLTSTLAWPGTPDWLSSPSAGDVKACWTLVLSSCVAGNWRRVVSCTDFFITQNNTSAVQPLSVLKCCRKGTVCLEGRHGVPPPVSLYTLMSHIQVHDNIKSTTTTTMTNS